MQVLYNNNRTLIHGEENIVFFVYSAPTHRIGLFRLEIRMILTFRVCLVQLNFSGESTFLGFDSKSSSASRAESVLVNYLIKQLLLVCKLVKCR